MANLKKKILGQVSGALGDLVFRERNGSNIIAVRPSSFSTPTDPASVERRGKFTMAAKLAGAINDSSGLKSLWENAAPSDLSYFNYFVKRNYIYVTSETPGNVIELVPSGGFPFASTNVDPAATQFDLTISALGTNNGIDTGVEVNIQTLSVLFLSNPSGENVPPYTFFTLSSGLQPLSLTDPISFISPLSGSQTLIYNQYINAKVYFALVTLDAAGKIIHYSVTEAS
jgi:hypothetical protein